MTAKRICAWCGKFLGFKEVASVPGFISCEPISHGLCKKCQGKIEKEMTEIRVVK